METKTTTALTAERQKGRLTARSESSVAPHGWIVDRKGKCLREAEKWEKDEAWDGRNADSQVLLENGGLMRSFPFGKDRVRVFCGSGGWNRKAPQISRDEMIERLDDARDIHVAAVNAARKILADARQKTLDVFFDADAWLVEHGFSSESDPEPYKFDWPCDEDTIPDVPPFVSDFEMASEPNECRRCGEKIPAGERFCDEDCEAPDPARPVGAEEG